MWGKLIRLTALVLVGLPFVVAHEANALTVSPLRFEYQGPPGTVFSDTLTLTNETTAPETFAASILDFIASADESGAPRFLPEGTKNEHSLVDWVIVDEPTVTLAPGESHEVSFAIEVPESASVGGYYSALLFSAITPTGQEVAVKTKTGPLILLSVLSNTLAENKGTVASFTSDQSITSHLPITFTTRINNAGAVHIEPQGEIRMTNLLGQIEAVLPFNQAEGNVLPSSTRQFTTVWQRQERSAETPEILKELKNSGIGRYRATLFLTNEQGQLQSQAHVDVWIVPWQIMLVTLFVVVFCVTFIRSRRKTIQRLTP